MVWLVEHKEVDGGQQEDRELLFERCMSKERVERAVPGDHAAQCGVERRSGERIPLMRPDLLHEFGIVPGISHGADTTVALI